MGYNVSFVGGDIFVGGSKVECFVKEILANSIFVLESLDLAGTSWHRGFSWQ